MAFWRIQPGVSKPSWEDLWINWTSRISNDVAGPFLRRGLHGFVWVRNGGEGRLVETLCLRGQVPLENLTALLEHPNWEVALSSAVGEWLADPKETVREEVAKSWRNAILKSRQDEYSSIRYWLGNIFKSDVELAFHWLRARLEVDEAPDRIWLAEEGPYSTAVSALDENQRILLLKDLEGRNVPSPLAQKLVNKSSRVYVELLRYDKLRRFHLEPLHDLPDEAWAELAVLALQSGHDARSIAQAAFSTAGIKVSSGPPSSLWSQRDEEFARLAADPRAEVQDIASHGRRIAQELLGKAKAQERLEEIRGI